MAGQLRIIGGRWRGQRLAVGQARGLRPTADRTRETLFNWLQADIGDARVLDLFAGTGALGLEALSRGAASAVFVERSAVIARTLQEQLRRLGAEQQARVLTLSAERYLRGPAQPFDVVFLDPPFADDCLPVILPLLAKSGWLAASANVYVETARQSASVKWPSGWLVRREKQAGAVWYGLLTVSTNPPSQL